MAPTMKPLQRVVTLGGIAKQKLARTLTSLSKRLAPTPTPDQYGDFDYSNRAAQLYPAVLNERPRYPKLNKTTHQYSGNVKQHSRAPSSTGRTDSGLGPSIEDTTPSRGQSP